MTRRGILVVSIQTFPGRTGLFDIRDSGEGRGRNADDLPSPGGLWAEGLPRPTLRSERPSGPPHRRLSDQGRGRQERPG
jgi:hypothetical protein